MRNLTVAATLLHFLRFSKTRRPVHPDRPSFEANPELTYILTG
jgi:hypothetical protein